MTMTKRTFSSNEETRLLTLRKYTALPEKVLGKNILRFPSPHTEQYTPQRSGGGDGSKEAPKTQNVPRIFPMIVDGISRLQFHASKSQIRLSHPQLLLMLPLLFLLLLLLLPLHKLLETDSRTNRLTDR